MAMVCLNSAVNLSGACGRVKVSYCLLAIMIFVVSVAAEQEQLQKNSSISATNSGLSDLDMKRLSELDKQWAVVTPRFEQEFLKVSMQSHHDVDTAVSRVRNDLNKGFSVICYQEMQKSLDMLLQSDPNNKILEEYYEYLKNGDAVIYLERNPRAPTRQLNCPPSIPCPTLPPTCVNDMSTLICNVRINCARICTALVEDLWVSGCIFFRDCAELIFTSSDFGNLFDSICVTGVSDPQKFVVSHKVFTQNIYQGDNCESQLMAREVLPGDQTQTPVAFVDFAIPVDFDATDTNPIEVDIHFLVPIANDTTGNILFEVCSEFKENGTLPYIVTPPTATSAELINVTNFGGTESFNHYKVTACLDNSGIAGCGLGRLMFRRIVAPDTEFNLPVYVVSLVFRYPRMSCRLPINCTGP